MDELTAIEDPGILLAAILKSDREVGMLEMGGEKNSFPVPEGFIALGQFECDPVAIDQKSGEVVVFDHEVAGRVISKAAIGIREFIAALSLVHEYYESVDLDDEEDDEEGMKTVAEEASIRAGGEGYETLWYMFFGV